VLTEDEAAELYDKLLIELRKRRDVDKPSEPDDFLRAIEAEIEAGKPVQVTLRVRSEGSVDDPIAGSSRKVETSSGEFIQRQEYSPREKLEILVNGLNLTAIAPPLLARRFAATIEQLSDPRHFDVLRFGDDQTVDPRRNLAKTSIAAEVAVTSTLRNILEEVLRELSDRPAALARLAHR
jgi:hypothetical protein